MSLHLEKMIISNARRFGKDIELEFGSGASIILAPNGTGKTTVFEAIEFALTGEIMRLDKPPLCFLGDEKDGMDVSLFFSNDKTCKVSYKIDSNPELSGDHKEILNGRTTMEVPSLLRLTHLLEQRGSNWFVQQRDTDAGSLLDKLAIGNDLSWMISSKKSNLMAATASITSKRKELSEQQQILSEIKIKIQKRDELKIEKQLKPIEEIYYDLKKIHDEYSPDEMSVERIDLDSVNSILIKTNDLLSLSADNYTKDFSRLSSLENRVVAFINLNQELEKLFKHRKVLEKEAKEFEKEVDDLTKVVDDRKRQIKGNENRLEELSRLEEKIKSVSLKNEKTEDLLKQISAIQKNLSDSKSNINKVTKEIDSHKALLENFNLLTGRRLSIEKEMQEIVEDKQLIETWQKFIEDQKKQKQIVAQNQIRNKHAKDNLDIQQQKLKILENEYTDREKNLNSLRQAFGLIQEAVGVIAENIDPDESTCPVCETEYEDGELVSRIDKALKQINPSIQSETANLKNFQQEIKKQSGLVNEALTLVNESLRSLTSSEVELNRIVSVIEQQFSSKISFNSPEEASQALKKKDETLDVALNIIEKDIVQLGRKPDKSFLTSLEDNLSRIRIEEERFESELLVRQSKISKLNDEIDLLKKSTGEHKLKSVINEISILKSKLDESKSQLKDLIETKNVLKNKLDRVNIDFNETQKSISNLESSKIEIHAYWKDLQLPGDPDLKALNDKKLEIRSKEEQLKKNHNEIKPHMIELSKWKGAAKYNELNREIKDIITSSTEGDFVENLESNVQSVLSEIEFMESRKEVLNGLYENLQREKVQLEEYTSEINPLWISLLKRVVLNPRFAKTNLESFSHQNKKYANTTLNLHGKEMKVMDIASEAQITDLQLTFMLSMASSYSWTPWKCLLLDDPTQHHDLVHASSVFDLLREYIIEQDFQVILGTHDTLQARFFQRKLQNEGVPAKIWKLVGDEGGVKANLVKY